VRRHREGDLGDMPVEDFLQRARTEIESAAYGVIFENEQGVVFRKGG
jgi:hypothetical protein